MATIEHRLTQLEKARAETPSPLVLWIDGERTDEQRRAIEEAERAGRLVLLLFEA